MEKLLDLEREAAMAIMRLQLCQDAVSNSDRPLFDSLEVSLGKARAACSKNEEGDEKLTDLLSPRSARVQLAIGQMKKQRDENVMLLEVALGKIKLGADKPLRDRIRELLIQVVSEEMQTPVYDNLCAVDVDEQSLETTRVEITCSHCSFSCPSKLVLMKHVDVEHGSIRRRANSSKNPPRPVIKKVVEVKEERPLPAPVVHVAENTAGDEKKKKRFSVGPRTRSSPDMMTNTGPLKRDVEQEQIVQAKKMQIEQKRSETPKNSPLRQDEEQKRLVEAKKKEMKEAEKQAVRSKRMRRRSTFSGRRSSKGSGLSVKEDKQDM